MWNILEKLKSRKLWVTLGALAAIIFGDLPAGAIQVIGIIVGIYNASQAFVDGAKEKAAAGGDK